MNTEFDAKKHEQIDLLSAQINLFDDLQTNPLFSSKDFPALALEELYKKSKTLLKKVKKDEFEVAVIGLEKAGKSTFANALVENNLLPSATERCTFTTTCLMSSTDGKDSAEICFYSEEEFNQNFRTMLSEVNYPLEPELTYKNLELAVFDAHIENLKVQNPDLFDYKTYIIADIRDILSTKEDLEQLLTGNIITFDEDKISDIAFKHYITGKNGNVSKPRSVKYINIFSSKLKEMKNIVMYDVPGFDSPTELHKKQTKERLENADVIILITNVATNPSLQGTTLDILIEGKDKDGIPLKDKLFIFGNQLDRVNHIEELTKNRDTLEKDVEKHQLAIKERVFVGSAHKHLRDRDMITGGHSNIPLENSGIDSLREALFHYYETDRFNILEKNIKQNLEAFKKELNYILSFNYRISTDKESALDDIKDLTKDELENRFVARLNKFRDEESTKEKSGVDNHENEDIQKLKALFSQDELFQKIRVTEDDVTNENSRSKRAKSITSDGTITSAHLNIRSEKQIALLNSFNHIFKDFINTKFDTVRNNIINEIVQGVLDLERINHRFSSQIRKEVEIFVDKVLEKDAYNSDKLDYVFVRFSRNLFDVILYPIGDDNRLEKVENAAKDFLILDTYYASQKGCDDFTLINLLLTQGQEGESLFRRLIKMAKDEYEPFSVKAVDTVIDFAAKKVEKAKGLFSNVNLFNRNKENEEQNVNHSQDQMVDALASFFKQTHRWQILTKDVKKLIPYIPKSKTPNEIAEEINKDIDIIRDIMENSVVYAMGLDIILLSKFQRQIQLLLDSHAYEYNSLHYNDFRQFIRNVVNIIKQEEIQNIDRVVEENQQKLEMIEKIKAYLG
ncbi:hypothetical protein A4G20_03635 [Pasteurellaceae bacterium RH1A]|nr:hypothetical protein A4G20_03635 [Pasteurellaceae bacterium RH1A]